MAGIQVLKHKFRHKVEPTFPIFMRAAFEAKWSGISRNNPEFGGISWNVVNARNLWREERGPRKGKEMATELNRRLGRRGIVPALFIQHSIALLRNI
jgi:hypothetical protein